jgi:hypothetical protein
LDPERVIVGEEIMTTRGEILAAFVSEEIPPGLSPLETIRRLKEQGAFISVSHPFDRLRKGGWLEQDLLEILPQVDAIEVYNSRCMLPSFNWEAQRFAEKHNLAGTVGSDAHAAFELGKASFCWSRSRVRRRCAGSSETPNPSRSGRLRGSTCHRVMRPFTRGYKSLDMQFQA